ncbi:hypothetical protein Bhyg_09236 [Pseudolycoriella hygida]|uniref:WAP domain-containing protein n=1 Tax=Pseudolycoriella hygida TaxID=35572 RepID=A0A9Q0N6A2_9DIPT|nr:hypothetical protein Bhyg_09236 [Pseudolycoriella hygida]
MCFSMKIVLLTISLVVVHNVDGSDTVKSEHSGVGDDYRVSYEFANPDSYVPKYGCPNPTYYRQKSYQPCDLNTDYPCRSSQICCATIFGTTCENPTFSKYLPIRGCPPIDPDVRCIWFNEQCRGDLDCPPFYKCCADVCGTQCVSQYRRYRRYRRFRERVYY